MSLVWGGEFDIQGSWAPSHKGHRVGTSVDIDRYDSSLDSLMYITFIYNEAHSRIEIGAWLTAKGEQLLRFAKSHGGYRKEEKNSHHLEFFK